MQDKKPIILYFVDGPFPSEKDFAEALELGTTRFRNAQYVGPNDNPEECDFVAGAVPKAYSKIEVAKVAKKPATKPQAPAPATPAQNPSAQAQTPAAQPPPPPPPAAK